MYPKSLPFALAALVLLFAGLIAWFVLTRPVPPGSVVVEVPTNTPERLTEEGAYYEVDAAYPSGTPLRVSAGAQADAKAVATMKAYAEARVASFKAENQVEALTSADAVMIPGLGVDRKYAFGMEYKGAVSPTTISYIFLVYEDTLGAHPNAYYKTFTFDAASGAELSIRDLFVPAANFLGVLSEKSREILVPQIAAAYSVPIAELDRTMLDEGTSPSISNFQTFYLEADALVLIFPPYQVGPWALGAQEARIPRSELSDILQERYR